MVDSATLPLKSDDVPQPPVFRHLHTDYISERFQQSGHISQDNWFSDYMRTTLHHNFNDSEDYLNFLEAFLTLKNATNSEGIGIEYPDFTQIHAVRATFIISFAAVCLIAIIGNLFVCLTVYKNKAMHTPVNYYIVNLSVCDFLVGAVVLPVKLFELTADAELNVMSDSLCTIIRFLESIVVFACVFTLVGICFERYNAIVNPVQSRINMTNCRIRRVLTLVWIVSILLSSPNLYPATAVFHSLYSDFGEFTRVTCFDGFSDTFRFVYFLTLFLLVFFLPLGFITTTCFSIARELFKEIPAQQSRDSRSIHLEQGRRKVAKMVLVIVLSFLLCWSPYFSVTLVTQLQSENFLHGGQYFFTMLLINLFAFANSCINPFIYFAMSTRFRRGFLSIMCSSCRTTTSQQRLGSHAMPSSNQTTNGVMTRQTTFSLRILSTQRESMRRENVSRRESRAGVGVGKTIIISQPACAE